MHQDCWTEIITFLQPIDILTSLVTLNHSLHNLIKNSCIITLDTISEFHVGCGDLKISLNNHDDHRESIDHVPIYGNAKYFIRLHLLKLALKLGNKNPTDKFQNEISDILNSSELELLDFYRSVFFHECTIPQKEELNELIIPYYFLAEAGVGTTFLCDFIQYGKPTIGYRSGVDFFFKKFTIPNEIECHHQIWKPYGMERFFSKEDMVKRNIKYNKDMRFLPCFSMNHEVTLETVGDWMTAIRNNSTSGKLASFGIIIGLTTNDYRLRVSEEKKVSLKDAVKKVFELNKSVFMECDERHVFSPFWFIQLQSTYFTLRVREEKQEEKNTWNCSLL